MLRYTYTRRTSDAMLVPPRAARRTSPRPTTKAAIDVQVLVGSACEAGSSALFLVPVSLAEEDVALSVLRFVPQDTLVPADVYGLDLSKA